MAEHFDVFLSYNRLDRRVVEPLAQGLHERELKVFKDDWYLRPGEFWPDTAPPAPRRCHLVRAHACSARSQPPSSRPISPTMLPTCAYWPSLSQRQRCTRRR